MTLETMLDKLDELNDDYENLYDREIHNLSDKESEELTVKDFILNILFDQEELIKSVTQFQEEHVEFNI